MDRSRMVTRWAGFGEALEGNSLVKSDFDVRFRKDVTKALRKRGLLDTDADKSELKATIARVARIRKEGNKSFVVLQ